MEDVLRTDLWGTVLSYPLLHCSVLLCWRFCTGCAMDPVWQCLTVWSPYWLMQYRGSIVLCCTMCSVCSVLLWRTVCMAPLYSHVLHHTVLLCAVCAVSMVCSTGCISLNCSVLFCTILFCTVLYCDILCYYIDIQYHTMYCPVQFYTVACWKSVSVHITTTRP